MIPMVDLEGIRRPEEPDQDYFDEMLTRIGKAYDLKRALLGPDLTLDLARYVILETIDGNWRDHLLGIDELREGIHLVAHAQLDPLVEYQREASYMFQDLMRNIQRLIFERFFRYTIAVEQQRAANIDYGRGSTDDPAADGGDMVMGADGAPHPRAARPQPQTYHRAQPKVGRNDPCPCGSGKKYKKCCGRAA
jgi:preprotein translocase subunit SecA